MVNTKKALDNLFVSRVRIKLLHYFLVHKDIPVHLRGAVREINEEINAVRRELNRLEEIKLLKSESRGNRKYFMLNPQGPLVDELTGMIFKTFGLGGDVLRNINKLGDVSYAILTEDYISGVQSTEHNVDLIMIGEIDLDALSQVVDEAERKEKREINYTVLGSEDFELRKKRRDSFVMDILLTPKLLLVGSERDLLA
ncbi:MAG: hypothetical protein ACOCXP_01005 [Candidatus Dojkabacteria bacterium]